MLFCCAAMLGSTQPAGNNGKLGVDGGLVKIALEYVNDGVKLVVS